MQVLWEIFSDKLGGSMPQVYDLLFTGQWPNNVASIPSKQRPGTATPVALFSGATSKYCMLKHFINSQITFFGYNNKRYSMR